MWQFSHSKRQFYLSMFLMLLFLALVDHCLGVNKMSFYVKIAPSWKIHSELMAQFEGKELPLPGGNFNLIVFSDKTSNVYRRQRRPKPALYPNWVRVEKDIYKFVIHETWKIAEMPEERESAKQRWYGEKSSKRVEDEISRGKAPMYEEETAETEVGKKRKRKETEDDMVIQIFLPKTGNSIPLERRFHIDSDPGLYVFSIAEEDAHRGQFWREPPVDEQEFERLKTPTKLSPIKTQASGDRTTQNPAASDMDTEAANSVVPIPTEQPPPLTADEITERLDQNVVKQRKMQRQCYQLANECQVRQLFLEIEHLQLRQQQTALAGIPMPADEAERLDAHTRTLEAHMRNVDYYLTDEMKPWENQQNVMILPRPAPPFVAIPMGGPISRRTRFLSSIQTQTERGKQIILHQIPPSKVPKMKTQATTVMRPPPQSNADGLTGAVQDLQQARPHSATEFRPLRLQLKPLTPEQVQQLQHAAAALRERQQLKQDQQFQQQPRLTSELLQRLLQQQRSLNGGQGAQSAQQRPPNLGQGSQQTFSQRPSVQGPPQIEPKRASSLVQGGWPLLPVAVGQERSQQQPQHILESAAQRPPNPSQNQQPTEPEWLAAFVKQIYQYSIQQIKKFSQRQAAGTAPAADQENTAQSPSLVIDQLIKQMLSPQQITQLVWMQRLWLQQEQIARQIQQKPAQQTELRQSTQHGTLQTQSQRRVAQPGLPSSSSAPIGQQHSPKSPVILTKFIGHLLARMKRRLQQQQSSSATQQPAPMAADTLSAMGQQEASANAPVELLVQSWENLTGVPTQQEYEPAHTEENPPKSRQKQLVDRGKKPRKDSTIGIGKKWRQSLVTNSPGELRGQRQGKKRKNDNQGEGSNQQVKEIAPTAEDGPPLNVAPLRFNLPSPSQYQPAAETATGSGAGGTGSGKTRIRLRGQERKDFVDWCKKNTRPSKEQKKEYADKLGMDPLIFNFKIENVRKAERKRKLERAQMAGGLSATNPAESDHAEIDGVAGAPASVAGQEHESTHSGTHQSSPVREEDKGHESLVEMGSEAANTGQEVVLFGKTIQMHDQQSHSAKFVPAASNLPKPPHSSLIVKPKTVHGLDESAKSTMTQLVQQPQPTHLLESYSQQLAHQIAEPSNQEGLPTFGTSLAQEPPRSSELIKPKAIYGHLIDLVRELSQKSNNLDSSSQEGGQESTHQTGMRGSPMPKYALDPSGLSGGIFPMVAEPSSHATAAHHSAGSGNIGLTDNKPFPEAKAATEGTQHDMATGGQPNQPSPAGQGSPSSNEN